MFSHSPESVSTVMRKIEVEACDASSEKVPTLSWSLQLTPASSLTSLSAATEGVSPLSMVPPGKIQNPFFLRELSSKTSSPLTIKPPARCFRDPVAWRHNKATLLDKFVHSQSASEPTSRRECGLTFGDRGDGDITTWFQDGDE